MDEHGERRQHPRSKVRWPVNILTEDGVIEGESRDIAVDGMSVCIEEPLRLDQTFRMGIMPPDHPMIEFTGKVIWSDLYCMGSDESPYGVGVCFVEVADEDRHFFKEVLKGPTGS